MLQSGSKLPPRCIREHQTLLVTYISLLETRPPYSTGGRSAACHLKSIIYLKIWLSVEIAILPLRQLVILLHSHQFPAILVLDDKILPP